MRSAESTRQSYVWRLEDRDARQVALGPLPAWCNVEAMDDPINGEQDLLWRAFQRHECATRQRLGGRGGRFIKAMAEMPGEDNIEYRRKRKRMCKHDDDLMGVFENASTSRPRMLRPAPFP